MLRCYMLAVCAGSSHDKASNNFTLFSLVEQIHLPKEALGATVPFEVHAYFMVQDAAAKHSQFEMRVIRVAPDGSEDEGATLPFQTAEGPRLRVKCAALRLPRTFGAHALRLEWRRRGDGEWRRDEAIWPLEVEQAPVAPATPAPVLAT